MKKNISLTLSKTEVRTNMIQTYLYGMDTTSYKIIDILLSWRAGKEDLSFYDLLKDYLGSFDIFSHTYYFIIFEEVLKSKKHTEEDIYELISKCTS